MKHQAVPAKPERLQFGCVNRTAALIPQGTTVYWDTDGFGVSTTPSARAAGTLIQDLSPGEVGYTQMWGVHNGNFINAFGGGGASATTFVVDKSMGSIAIQIGSVSFISVAQGWVFSPGVACILKRATFIGKATVNVPANLQLYRLPSASMASSNAISTFTPLLSTALAIPGPIGHPKYVTTTAVASVTLTSTDLIVPATDQIGELLSDDGTISLVFETA